MQEIGICYALWDMTDVPNVNGRGTFEYTDTESLTA